MQDRSKYDGALKPYEWLQSIAGHAQRRLNELEKQLNQEVTIRQTLERDKPVIPSPVSRL